MRAAMADRRIIMPTAAQWTLRGGAYRDGDEIVLPGVGAEGRVPLPLAGSVHILWWKMQRVLVPAGGDGQLYRNVSWLGPNRATATPAQPSGGSAHPIPPGVWSVAPQRILYPGPNIHWIELVVRITSPYGVPGTRFIPGPEDLQLTYL